MPKHTYEAAEKYILSREFFGMKLGLENIRTFLESIGTPQNSYKTIHIAGTNGKGSTAAMLDAILRAQGYKTGLFTSPHLVSFRERIKVDGEKISTRFITSFIDCYRKELSKRKLSFFELTTALAFKYFDHVGVDIAVIETGLGGRLDASNVLLPILTVTTDISRDHMEILGSSLSKIAYEKAGIIKREVPHLTGILPEKADKVIKERCVKLSAPYYRLLEKETVYFPDRMALDFKYNGLAVTNLRPSLVGVHQLKNTALVLKAVSILKEHRVKISKKAIIEGITHTSWPGRFQIMHKKNKPLHIFDVSHNAGGMRAFVDSFKLRFPDKKAYVLTGFVKKKEHQKIFNYLSEIAISYAIVPLDTKRSIDIGEFLKTINFRGIPIKRYGSLLTAYNKVLINCDNDDIIIIIGSHYLVGEFFSKFNLK